ncbi:hypothetical protein [Streptomyces sp. 135]|uniref:hypothetical protein n=1 Tax=Streptomyces sp. 135 TaxID=2838850 RepID=UPI001CBB632B|nr:hypothetical protein [Streptomyces sp. 135]
MTPGRARWWLAVGAYLTAALAPAWRAPPSTRSPTITRRGLRSRPGDSRALRRAEGHRRGRDRDCVPGALPSAQPRRGERAAAAGALAGCLAGAVPSGRTTGSGGTTLRAATLSVTGLYCPPGADVCRASVIHLSRPRIRYGQGEAASCLAAEELSLTGAVRFRAASLHGRLLGVLPLTVSTRTVPPVPVPFLRLDAVVARGLWVKAGEGTGSAVTVGPGSGACGAARPGPAPDPSSGDAPPPSSGDV